MAVPVQQQMKSGKKEKDTIQIPCNRCELKGHYSYELDVCDGKETGVAATETTFNIQEQK